MNSPQPRGIVEGSAKRLFACGVAKRSSNKDQKKLKFRTGLFNDWVSLLASMLWRKQIVERSKGKTCSTYQDKPTMSNKAVVVPDATLKRNPTRTRNMHIGYAIFKNVN